MCPENLKTFLEVYDPRKINVKFADKNCLHILIDMLLHDKYEQIADCIKILILNGCDPNIPDKKSKTPFYSLLRVQPQLKNQNELVDFIVEKSAVDIYTYKHDEMKRMFENQNPHLKLPEKVETIVNADFLLSLLRAKMVEDFDIKFKHFKENSMINKNENNSNNYAQDCAELLYIAVQNDLENVVELLLKEGVDVDSKSCELASKSPPAFLASSCGFYRILEVIMRANPRPETTFKNRNLLLEVSSHFGITESEKNKSVDYQKCFNIVLDRCDVNAQDDLGRTPLHYAVRYFNDKAAKALLKKSSYIGTTNNFGETPIDPIDDVNLAVFEDFLDDCITTNVRRSADEKEEILFDFSFLIAPKNSKIDAEFRQEIAPLRKIADKSELRELILHPVLSGFLHLKWSKLSLLFYGNLLLFSIFMMSLITYIVLCQTTTTADSGVRFFFYISSIISISILMLFEIFLCAFSFKNYVKTPTNWLQIAVIILGWFVLLQTNHDDIEEFCELC